MPKCKPGASGFMNEGGKVKTPVTKKPTKKPTGKKK
jgi:hypothetical protein